MTDALAPAPDGVRGRVVVPGSKSETNRALVLAALGDGPSRITGALESRDSRLMVDALRALGVSIELERTGSLVVTPPEDFLGGATVDCGLAGTVMRFVPPLALLATGPVTFVGDERAAERPMRGLLDALRALGATIDGDAIPCTVTPGTVDADEVTVDASASSQFVSGLLLLGASLPNGLTIHHEGASVPSRPHIAMTCAMIRERGVEARDLGPTSWHVAGGGLHALDTQVEPDLTNAAAFLAAAAMTGGEVSVPGWPETTTQPGALILDVLERMGAITQVFDGVARVLPSPVGLQSPGIVDLHEASELTPVVAALAALAQGTTTITGVAHIRGHETDRLAALATELARAGIEVKELPDGLRIVGGVPRAAAFRAYADHRMVHFAALLALVTPGCTIDDPACVDKTMPQFHHLWRSLL